MEGDSTTLVALLLFLAAAAGWFAARLTRRRSNTRRGTPPDYYRGVNYLLNDQSDKALAVFTRMAEMDSGTVEIQFALGSLFRQRGEVERAIRTHQNIIARPDLPRVDRDKAMFELAVDYLRAGVQDRAESLLGELSGVAAHRDKALRLLARIYEQQQDWEQAIATRRSLAADNGDADERIVAHYYCELAEAARAQNDLTATRRWLKKANDGRHAVARGAILRARLACSQGEPATAMRLYLRVLEHNPDLAAVVLPDLVSCLERCDGDLAGELGPLLRRHPRTAAAVARAAVLTDTLDDPLLVECVDRLLDEEPALRELRADLSPEADGEAAGGGDDEGTGAGESAGNGTGGGGRAREVRRIARLLRRLAGARPRCHCEVCGYSGETLHWQCPGCHTWDSIRPDMRLGPLDRAETSALKISR